VGDERSDPITVVLADDHAVMRNGLRMLLDAEHGVEVVAEAGNIDGMFQHVRGHRPQVLVLDLNMPGGSSIAAIPRLTVLSPETAIVVLTMEPDPTLARDALQAGAHGYVLKTAAGRELVRAVRAAAQRAAA
jgi:two-component system, NarL family, response regulator NreC